MFEHEKAPESFGNKEESDEKFVKSGKISRRAFFRRAGDTLLGTAALWYAPTAEKRVWSKEVKEGDSWLDGVRALRDEALHAQTESAVWFSENKNGGKWKNFSYGDTLSVDFTEEDENLFIELSKEKPEKLRYAHVHPLEALVKMGIQKETVEAMRRNNPPALPPSFNDIKQEVVFQERVFDINQGTNFSELVFDPRGFWEITSDTKHPFALLSLEYDNVYKKVKEHLSEEELQSMFEELEKHPRYINMFPPDPDKEPFRAAWYEINMKFNNQFLAKRKRLLLVYMKFIKDVVNQKTPDYAQMIRAYKPFGVNVAFIPYKEIGIE